MKNHSLVPIKSAKTISILVALIFLYSISCKNKKETYKVTFAPVTESVYASGIVKSKNQYDVFSKANGIIAKIYAREGDFVKKGDSILEIQSEAARINNANARLTAAYSSLSGNQSKLKEAEANVALALSKLKQDSLLWDRQKKLWSNNIGSRLELEQRELGYKASFTAYSTALLKLEDLKKEIEFREDQSLNNLELSNSLKLDNIVRSEIDGKLYGLSKEVGEMVSVQMPIAVIGDANEFVLEFQVDESDIALVKKGQKAIIRLDSQKGKIFEAEITKVNPLMNSRTKSFLVEASFINKPEVLYPNLTLEANIIIQSKPKALTIPRKFLLNDSTVIDADGNNKFIRIGMKDFQQVEVLSGLQEGEEIEKPR